MTSCRARTEDVIALCYKISLEEEADPGLVLEKAEVSQTTMKQEWCMVGWFFFYGKNSSFKRLRTPWQHYGDRWRGCLSWNYHRIYSCSSFSMNAILLRWLQVAPGRSTGNLLLSKRLEEGGNPTTTPLFETNIWVQIPDLPPQLASE